MTRLALVNAIYFKGNWMNRFDEANTKEMPFKVKQVKNKRSHLTVEGDESTHVDSCQSLILSQSPRLFVCVCVRMRPNWSR